MKAPNINNREKFLVGKETMLTLNKNEKVLDMLTHISYKKFKS